MRTLRGLAAVAALWGYMWLLYQDPELAIRIFGWGLIAGALAVLTIGAFVFGSDGF